jgi:uncharacterized membrane protein YdbT with pleckstrin-like domain
VAYPADRGFAVAFGATALAGVLAATAYFLSLRYALDGHYITKAAGVLWRHRRSIPLDKVTSIDVRQGPVERLLRMGQIWVYTPASGSDAPEERLIGVRDPLAVKEAIVRAAEAELRRAADEALCEARGVRSLLGDIDQRLARLEQHLVPAQGVPAAAAADPAPAPGAAVERDSGSPTP